MGVGLLAHLAPPTFERRNRELRGVMIDAHADPSLVAHGVVDAVRDDLAETLVDEVVHADGLRLAFALPLTPAVLEVAHELLFLGVHGYDGLSALHERLRGAVDVLELRVAIRRLPSLPGLADDLEAVLELVQKSAHHRRAHLVAPCTKLGGKLVLALARPA